MTSGTHRARMPARLTAVCLVGGVVLALAGLAAMTVLAIGTFQDDRDGVVTALSGMVYLTAAASLLVLPFHRRVGKFLGSVALLMLATALLVAVFNPAIAAGTPGPYQAAAIALIVLLLARLALAMRNKSKNTEH